MSFFKRAFITTALSISMFVPLVSFAATDNSALIAQLLAQIKVLLAQLQQLRQQQSDGQWCHTFNTNLGFGNTGSEMSYLTQILEDEGFPIAEKGNIVFFGESTASAVTGFQEKYKDEILTPNGLKYGTGYVGKSTRAKLNQLYGCNNSVPPTPSPLPLPPAPLPPPPPVPTTIVPTADIKVSGSDGPVIVKLLDPVAIMWSSTNASYCMGSGYSLVGSNYGRWGFSKLPSTGQEIIGGIGSVSTLTFGIQCWDDKGTASKIDTVTINVVAQTIQPSITVTSPNGGEQYQLGSQRIISWKSVGATANAQFGKSVRIDLMDGNNVVYNIGSSILVDSIINTFQWIISPSINKAGNNYKIRISTVGQDGSGADSRVYDLSDSSFSIVASGTQSAPTISYISPTSGSGTQNINVFGSGFTVTENTINLTNKIDFTKTYQTHAPSSNGSSLSFALPSGMILGDYNVEVGNASGSSNNVSFSVVSADQPPPPPPPPPLSTIKLNISSDNEINSKKPDSVLSSSVYISIGHSTTYGEEIMRYLGYVDVSSLSGKNIQKAVLKIDRVSNSWDTTSSYSFLQMAMSFNSNTVTWNNASSTVSGVAVTGVLSQYGIFEFDITDIVKGWVSGSATNNGFVIKKTNEQAIVYGLFASADYPSAGAETKPYLEVTY